MLDNKRVTIVGESIIDGERIATFGGVLNLGSLELSMTGRYLNKDACKLHRDTVRADQAEFEDYAYMIQDTLQSIESPNEVDAE